MSRQRLALSGGAVREALARPHPLPILDCDVKAPLVDRNLLFSLWKLVNERAIWCARGTAVVAFPGRLLLSTLCLFGICSHPP